MSFWNSKIEHPITAFAVVFILAAIMANYGMVNGSLLIFDFFAGIAVYKWVTSSRN